MNKKKRISRFLLATVAVILIVLPLYFMFIAGFMSVSEIQKRPPYLFPPNPSLEYYRQAWKSMKPYLRNSVILALSTSALTLILAPLSAFGLARFRLKVNSLVYGLIYILQILPGVSMITPLFLVFYKIGLINNRLSVILALTAFQIPFASLILSNFMKAIPDELFESAMLDGAGPFRLFWNIALPLSKPALATVGLFAFMAGWGDLLISLTFLQKQHLQPASVGMALFSSIFGTQWNLMMAAGVYYAMIPILASLVASKYFVAGFLAGAFK